jgi:hypothetical protein
VGPFERQYKWHQQRCEKGQIRRHSEKKNSKYILNDDIIYVSLYRKFQTLKTIIMTPTY